MHLESQAIVIKTARFQENSLIIDCFSREHGIIKGLVKSRKMAQIAAPGTLVHAVLKARLPSHLGMLSLESIRTYLSLIGFDRLKLRLLNCALILCSTLLSERDAHPNLYDTLLAFLEELTAESDSTHTLKTYALLELEMMKEAGYGLDLSKCVVSNATVGLAYISPKSGCAVSTGAGQPYHDKLFKMPAFYLNNAHPTDSESVTLALKINEFFLRKRIFEPNNMRMIEERCGLCEI